MTFLNRPLTEGMVAQLQKARAIELSKTENDTIVTEAHFKNSMSGLIRRGIVDTKMVMFHGKRLLRVYITERGLEQLANYEDKRPSAEQKIL